jgi:predicted nuclease of restriction endonuclease-like (RecB) superfamily
MPKAKPDMKITDTGKSVSKPAAPLQSQFAEVAALIRSGKARAYAAINAELIDCYWRVGEYISRKVASDEWGSGGVRKLADYLQRELPDPRGFSDKNLWRMMQFFDFYSNYNKLSALLRELSWTSHMLILSKTKKYEERDFYIHVAIQERYSSRELERAIDSRLFQRTTAIPAKLSTPLRVLLPGSEKAFRDSYSLDFLGLPDNHSEADLRKAIVRDFKRFILEFGRDFAFVAEEYRVQVGMKDFSIDLLFFQRELQCLVAFELKIEEFKPEHLGKLSFYLEALDRDVKKPHEKPSVGIILCKEKDDEVVEYALSRTVSPAAIAEYTTRLPGKRLLQDKLHEFFDTSVRELSPVYGVEHR